MPASGAGIGHTLKMTLFEQLHGKWDFTGLASYFAHQARHQKTWQAAEHLTDQHLCLLVINMEVLSAFNMVKHMQIIGQNAMVA